MAYEPGLGAGDHCVELTIEDGGPNDTDGLADGVIRDVGGLAVARATAETTISGPRGDDPALDAFASEVVLLRFSLDTPNAGASFDTITLGVSGTGSRSANVTHDAR